jgi:hypothetical protein
MTMIPNPIGNPSDPDSAEQSPAADGGASPVGAGDHAADKARATGEAAPGDAATDSDGVPVGRSDAEADAERSRRES